jgi:hypothetical protein
MAPSTVTESIDPITGSKNLTTSTRRLQNHMTDPIGNPNFYISAVKIDTLKAITFEIYALESPGVISPETPVYLKYADMTVDTIYAITWGHPDASSTGSVYVTNWSVKFSCYLPKHVCLNILNKEVTYVRVSGDKYIDREILPEFASSFMQVVSLIQ